MSKYKDQVRAAAAALKRGEDANWELAKLTYQACGAPPGRGRANVTGVSTKAWAGDVAAESGRPFSNFTAAVYREVWHRFGMNSQGYSWSEAYAEIRGGTVGERMVEADFKRAIANASVEQKREALTTLANEHEVLDDDHTRRTVERAVYQIHQEKYPSITPEPIPPRDSTLDRRMFLADIARKVDDWTRELDGIHDFLEWSGDVDQLQRWSTRQALERLTAAAIRCRDVLPESYVEKVEAT